MLEKLNHHSKMLSDYEVVMLRDFKRSSNQLVMRKTLQDMGVGLLTYMFHMFIYVQI